MLQSMRGRPLGAKKGLQVLARVRATNVVLKEDLSSSQTSRRSQGSNPCTRTGRAGAAWQANNRGKRAQTAENAGYAMCLTFPRFFPFHDCALLSRLLQCNSRSPLCAESWDRGGVPTNEQDGQRVGSFEGQAITSMLATQRPSVSVSYMQVAYSYAGSLSVRSVAEQNLLFACWLVDA